MQTHHHLKNMKLTWEAAYAGLCLAQGSSREMQPEQSQRRGQNSGNYFWKCNQTEIRSLQKCLQTTQAIDIVILYTSCKHSLFSSALFMSIYGVPLCMAYWCPSPFVHSYMYASLLSRSTQGHMVASWAEDMVVAMWAEAHVLSAPWWLWMQLDQHANDGLPNIYKGKSTEKLHEFFVHICLEVDEFFIRIFIAGWILYVCICL